MIKKNIVEIELSESEIEEAIKAYVENIKSGTYVKEVEMVYGAAIKLSDVGLLQEQKISGCKVICTEVEE